MTNRTLCSSPMQIVSATIPSYVLVSPSCNMSNSQNFIWSRASGPSGRSDRDGLQRERGEVREGKAGSQSPGGRSSLSAARRSLSSTSHVISQEPEDAIAFISATVTTGTDTSMATGLARHKTLLSINS